MMLWELVVALVSRKSQSGGQGDVDRRCGQDVLANHVEEVV